MTARLVETHVPPPPKTAPDPATGAGRRLQPRHLLVGALLLAGMLGLGAWWVAGHWSRVFVDDARIGADMITVSSEVSGRVSEVAVVPGDSVAGGATLLRIDRDQVELELRGLEAQRAGLASQRRQLQAQQAMIRAQIASRLEAAAAQEAVAESAHESSKATLEKARSTFQRISSLAASSVMSRQTYDDAQAALRIATQQELSTAAGIELARANRAVVQADETQIAVLDHQVATLDAQIAGLEAQLAQKRLDLDKRHIAAAFAGVVDTTFVDPGEYVSAGTRLLIYHDPTKVWVDANVKETDFRRLRLGAKARITVDAYPSRVFEGRIVRLGHAATSQFALLPSPNPSGNFTKVTQRLPIRIAIAQEGGMLRPGMMIEASIDVAD